MAALHLKREIRAKILGMGRYPLVSVAKKMKVYRRCFQEFSVLMETVFEKHDGLLTHTKCHEIVDIWPMTKTS